MLHSILSFIIIIIIIIIVIVQIFGRFDTFLKCIDFIYHMTDMDSNSNFSLAFI